MSIKNDIPQTILDWQRAFSHSDLDAICDLYSADACLWGTFADEFAHTHQQIKNYFNTLFSEHTRTVTFGDVHIKSLQGLIICNGEYNFQWTEKNTNITIPARFTFVLLQQQSNAPWLITEHHSSKHPTSN